MSIDQIQLVVTGIELGVTSENQLGFLYHIITYGRWLPIIVDWSYSISSYWNSIKSTNQNQVGLILI